MDEAKDDIETLPSWLLDETVMLVGEYDVPKVAGGSSGTGKKSRRKKNRGKGKAKKNSHTRPNYFLSLKITDSVLLSNLQRIQDNFMSKFGELKELLNSDEAAQIFQRNYPNSSPKYICMDKKIGKSKEENIGDSEENSVAVASTSDIEVDRKRTKIMSEGEEQSVDLKEEPTNQSVDLDLEEKPTNQSADLKLEEKPTNQSSDLKLEESEGEEDTSWEPPIITDFLAETSISPDNNHDTVPMDSLKTPLMRIGRMGQFGSNRVIWIQPYNGDEIARLTTFVTDLYTLFQSRNVGELDSKCNFVPHCTMFKKKFTKSRVNKVKNAVKFTVADLKRIQKKPKDCWAGIQCYSEMELVDMQGTDEDGFYHRIAKVEF